MDRRALLPAALIGALLIGMGTMAFASGQNESASGPPFLAPPSGANSVVTLTGTVSVTNRIHPVLASGSTSYELLVPPFAVYDSGVKDGQSITVKGYTVDPSQLGPRFNYYDGGSTNVTYFVVTAATMNGKDYNPWAAGSRYGYGPRYGHGSGYGPGFGYGPGRGADRSYAPGPGGGAGPGYGPGAGYGPGMMGSRW